MSYSMQALNRVVSPRFAVTPLSPGAIDVRDLYLARGRLGTHMSTHLVCGPDLRSRVTRFGQGVAFTGPQIFTPKQQPAPTSVAPKAPIAFRPPTINVPPLPGFPGIHITLPGFPTPGSPSGGPPKVVFAPFTPMGAPPAPVPTPTSAGAPPFIGPTDSPITFNPGNLGITDQGYTQAPPPFSSGPSGDGGGGGGPSFSVPSDGGAAAAGAPGLGFDSSLLWVGLGALGLILLATQR